MAGTLNFFADELRRRGFIHITGLPIRNKIGRIAFPRQFWGKFSHDLFTTIIVILDNGEVWLKDGPWIDEEDLTELKKQMGDKTFEYSELEKEPYFLDVAVFASTISGMTLMIRLADPYFNFDGSCDTNPSNYFPETIN